MPLPPPLPAEIRADCAPWDGPAVVVRVPQRGGNGVPGTDLLLSIWRSPAIQSPLSLTFPRDDASGHARLQPRSGAAQSLACTVVFTRLSPDAAVEGRYAFVSETGTHVDGRFRAVWRGRGARCR